MPAHRIRLRGPWEWREPAHGPPTIQLPVATWPAGTHSPVRLARRFGRPAHDPAFETVRLELLDVPGLVAAELNGVGLAIAPIERDGWSASVGGLLLARNVLELVAELPPGLDPARPWGSIALVIGD